MKYQRNAYTANTLSLLTVLLLPVVVQAQDALPGTATAQRFVAKLNEVILFPLIALLLAIAFLFFLYGCFEYITNANNPQGREQGVRHITYGLIGLMIMVSAYAILNLVAGTFGLSL